MFLGSNFFITIQMFPLGTTTLKGITFLDKDSFVYKMNHFGYPILIQKKFKRFFGI